MTRKVAWILAVVLASPLAAFAADVQVNLNTAINVSIPSTQGELVPATFRTWDRKDGWVVKVAADALSTPAYGADKLFVSGGLSSNYVYAFNASTGVKDWQIQGVDGGPTAPSEDDGVVVYNTESCTTEAVAADTGKRLWTQTIGDPLYAQPAIADGKVFAVHPVAQEAKDQGRRYKLLCMDLKTGQHYWDVDISGDVLAAPVVANHLVYFTCSDGQAFCLDETNGGMDWQEKYLGTAAPVVADNQVIMTVKDDNGNEGLKRYDAKGGDAKDQDLLTLAKVDSIKLAKDAQVPWSYQGPRPVVAKGHVITAQSNAVTSVNLGTGKVDWRVQFHSFTSGWNANMFNSPALGAGKVYLTSTDGHILCLNADDGTIVFNYATGQKFGSQPILANGNVYATTTDGLLICFKTGDSAADGWYDWGGNAAHNK